MVRKFNTVGGGSQTNINGLSFERDTDLMAAFEKENIFKIQNIPSKYKSRTAKIFFHKDHIGYFYEKKVYIEISFWGNITLILMMKNILYYIQIMFL